MQMHASILEVAVYAELLRVRRTDCWRLRAILASAHAMSTCLTLGLGRIVDRVLRHEMLTLRE
jgi:hypothetical protein